MINPMFASFSEEEFLKSLFGTPKHINCRSVPGFIMISSGSISQKTIDHMMWLLFTDDELIDYHETKRIFKLYEANHPVEGDKIR